MWICLLFIFTLKRDREREKEKREQSIISIVVLVWFIYVVDAFLEIDLNKYKLSRWK